MNRNICIEAFVKAGMLTIINTKVTDYLIVVLYNFLSPECLQRGDQQEADLQ